MCTCDIWSIPLHLDYICLALCRLSIVRWDCYSLQHNIYFAVVLSAIVILQRMLHILFIYDFENSQILRLVFPTPQQWNLGI